MTYRADKDGYTDDVKFEGEAKYPEYVEKDYKPAASYAAPAYTAPVYSPPAYKAAYPKY